MHICKHFSHLAAYTPAESAADDASAQIVQAVLGIPLHERKILWYMVE